MKRCREAQLDQAICLNSLELLAPFPTLHHLTLWEHNQTHFNRGYLNCAKCALAVFSNIAIRQILRSSYISRHLSLRFRGQRIGSCCECVTTFCVCVFVKLKLRPPGVTFVFKSMLVFIWSSILSLCLSLSALPVFAFCQPVRLLSHALWSHLLTRPVSLIELVLPTETTVSRVTEMGEEKARECSAA